MDPHAFPTHSSGIDDPKPDSLLGLQDEHTDNSRATCNDSCNYNDQGRSNYRWQEDSDLTCVLLQYSY